MKIVCTSGFFDPIHSGHLECLRLAKELGDKLIVIVNSDEQALQKKGFVLMPIEQRISILREIGYIDAVIVSVDKDGSVCESLKAVRPDVFAKGGDRNVGNIPETQVCKELGIQIVDGLGDKVYSSRTVIKELVKNIDTIPSSYLEGK